MQFLEFFIAFVTSFDAVAYGAPAATHENALALINDATSTALQKRASYVSALDRFDYDINML